MSSTKRGAERIPRDLYVTPFGVCEALGDYWKHVYDATERPHIVDLGAGDGRIGLAVAREIDVGRAPDVGRKTLTLVDIQHWATQDYIDKPPKGYEIHTIERDYLKEGEFELGHLLNILAPTELIQTSKLDDSHNLNAVEAPRVLFVSNPPFSLALEFIEKTVLMLTKKDASFSDYSYAAFLLPMNWFGTYTRQHFLEWNPPFMIMPIVPRPSFTGGANDSNEYCWAFWERVDRTPWERKLRPMVWRVQKHGKGSRAKAASG